MKIAFVYLIITSFLSYDVYCKYSEILVDSSNIVETIDDGMKVVCYFIYSQIGHGTDQWVENSCQKTLMEICVVCTHIIYAFSVLDPTSLTIKSHDPWADIDNKFYERDTAYRQRGIKVLIAIGGWNDSLGNKYGRLLKDANARRNFITSVTAFIDRYHFDGLDLDLEYPGCWQNNCQSQRSDEKQAFVQLVKELSDAFKPRGWLLSAAVSAGQRVIDVAYDVPQLSQYLDWISMMTYDYHGSFDRQTGHIAPFYSSDNLNVNFTVNYWLRLGAPSKKLVVGAPSYGQSFTLANSANNGFNAPSNGPGLAGPFTRAPGTMAYYEICEKTKRNGWKVVRDPQNHVGPYAFQGNQWVSYDDVDNIRAKVKFIRSKNLGGGTIWALDFDDFNGSCGCGKNPLLTTFNQELRDIGGATVTNCT